ncbi:hypothetical protein C1637_18560 [Chryseobacterium lactis]|uniref:DUF6046 domain-containing protein n=1 Tax=Chryseobacterium lactis TaxID=1241981 RepID=A0A3G6RT93_CHRLC|nr:DUF6046 domain-containing protein [Chryseobacterium lactis]AZA84785.1 hypothetical protein EG342_24070 [Chryseobacterium lactis]AZB05174.1 hypothetical protein EG341_14950 [Chryseobacterium lactis]PNW12156.1 hypothetical protein C1637_18560 [Chryseobacterium lactis]
MQTVFDLQNLYKSYFSRNPINIPTSGTEVMQDFKNLSPSKNKNRGEIFTSTKGIDFNKTGAYGQDIWFPVEFRINGSDSLTIDACTIAVNLSKTVIRTAVSERKGTVKEMFSIDDYKFTIRGFLIDKNRKVPEADIDKLKMIFETDQPVTMHGGYPEIFLKESTRVAVTSLEFQEVQGKVHWIRPFSLTCESDFIADVKDLEVPKKNANTN